MRRVRLEGTRLWEDLFSKEPGLNEHLGFAQAKAVDDEMLYLRYSGPLSHLVVPHELARNGGPPLAASHPVSRHVTEVQCAREQEFQALVARLRLLGDPLRILLVAADLHGPGPEEGLAGTADHEVEALEKVMREAALRAGLRPEIVALRSREVTLEGCIGSLRNCQFHIVHFAGHVVDGPDEDTSGIALPVTHEGEVRMLGADRLWSLLKHSSARTFMAFLSPRPPAEIQGELGFVTAARASLGLPERGPVVADGRMRVAEALVRAGVPSVHAFRWENEAADAVGFAVDFYRELFESFSPALAAFRARRNAWEHGRLSYTGSVLIEQK